VSEWRDHYVNYKALKKALKRLFLPQQASQNESKLVVVAFRPVSVARSSAAVSVVAALLLADLFS
jgi:hypothetical protein